MNVICFDIEGVLIPEIWIKFAEKVGVDDLKVTTRDIPDYDELCTQYIKVAYNAFYIKAACEELLQ